MPENAPSNTAGDAAVDAGQALTPEAIDAVLQEFRGWLQQAALRVNQPADNGEFLDSEPEFSWQALAAEFIALRQEVNLQTRASRAQLEQNAEALEKLGSAVNTWEDSREEDDADAPDMEILRPLLKTLVDVYDALALARREVQRVQTTMEDLLAKTTGAVQPLSGLVREGSPTRIKPWRDWWLALTGRAVPPQIPADLEHRLAQLEIELNGFRQAEASRSQAADQARQVLNSMLVGYTMGLQRLERALAQHGLERIDCVGEPFDPECMEVAEVVHEPGRQGTEVLEEVRRGYYWRGKLFRFAQVRVSRP